MKQTNFIQKFKLLLVLAFAMLVGQNALATDIVAYSLASSSAATSGVAINFPTMGRTLTSSGVTSSGYSIGNGHTCYGWNAVGSDQWTTNAFSTIGYISLAVVGQMKAANTGPRDFKAQYRIGAGTWTDVPDDATYVDDNPLITLTNSFGASFKFRLPASCENNSSISVRLLQNSTVSVTGGSIGAALGDNASIKGVSVQAEAFAAPTSQSKFISIVSVTPTTITIACTPGSGNRRLLKINTVNSFTSPTNDVNYTGNSDYSSGSGEQTVFVGSGTTSKVVITVPSATSQYWLRYYEYNALGVLTRYSTLDEAANGNPKLCALENIHTPTYANVRLLNVDAGATIVTPTTGTILERGVYFNNTPGIDETSIISANVSSLGGIYSHPIVGGVYRGSTIYFRGYVTNESGTILTEDEASFSNVPIFTGTGNWGTAARWNVQEVPGANGDVTYGSVDDSPIIRGTCTLTASNSVTNLTIENTRSLAINTASSLNAVGTLTNDAGNSGILIKSAAGVANGSLIWATGTPSGTVQMYSKAYQDTKYHWQYFGIPVTSYTLGTLGANVRIRKYDETNHDATGNNVGLWKPSTTGGSLGNGDPLVPVDGYEVTQPAATTYSFTGTLNHANVSKTLAFTSAADWSGQHILANPFTAAVDISGLIFGVDTESNVYLYNAGSLAEWTAAGGATVDGTAAGQYTVSNGAFAGVFGVTAQIPSMQGFLVKAMNNNGGATFDMPYSSVMSNTIAQRAPKASNKVATRIDVEGAKYSDKMWIFTEPTATRAFDNGFDGPKILGSALTPQLYAMEEDGNYQINAVNDMNNTFLGFQAGSETKLKLVFTHQNLEGNYGSVYLVDLLENKTVDVTASGTEYAFTAEATPTMAKRFKIVTQTTAVKNPSANSLLKLISTPSSVILSNPTNEAGSLVIYNLSGSALQKVNFVDNGLMTIPINLGKGIYVAKAKTATEEVTEKLIIR